ncbi:MAG: DegT/DnrJ/EryC1/StrS family aminotransferase [Candidatus Yanofskybacteria bacterium]|nr:DegT/DnrJ/EryC1/StrS family aminotransferase [Candidatus Yanofskybacteria bacterium]
MKKIIYPLQKDTIAKEDHRALAQWIDSDPLPRLTMGSLVKKFEDKWSDWLGVKYSIACNSGSSANLLMYYTLLRSGRLKNKKIIVPSAAWVTTVAPAIQLGFEPIMCEADTKTFGLDHNHLEQLLKKHRPSTVIMVQVLGVPNDMDKIMKLKKKYKFFLLEDVCAAMGSKYKERKLGTYGDMASISTYFGHQFSTIEGGLVSTNDRGFYELLIMLRSHGWISGLSSKTRTNLLKKYKIADTGTHFIFCEPGFNFRLTDLQAFIGIRQLEKMDWLVENRSRNHNLYKDFLSSNFDIQEYDRSSRVCSIHFCVLADNKEERIKIIKALEDSGIETRPFTSGNQGLHPYWFREYGKFNAPVADRLYYCGFFLPNYPTLTTKDIKYICSVVTKAALKNRHEA